jgi:adenine-specific DNA-methyltransferase
VNSPEIKKWLGKVVGAEAEDLSRHDKWLCMMYPRLVLLKQFLREDGLMCIQIDDNEFANLFSICIEIYGESNLKVICVKMSEPSGLKMGTVKRLGTIPKLKEYIIICGKNGVKGLDIERIPKGNWDKEYNIFLDGLSKEDRDLITQISEQEEISLEDIELLDEIGARITLCSLADKVKELGLKENKKEKWLFNNAWRICQCATSASVLVLAKEKRKKNNNEVFFVKSARGMAYMVRGTFSETSTKPRVQLIFADDNLTVHAGDLWSDLKTTGLDGEGGVDFKNGKKPEALVSRIIRMCTKQDDLVLDSFLGSGTTAAVAHKMNRRYVGIEMGEQAQTHCRIRLKKVIEGEQGGISNDFNWIGGGGFQFCRLSTEPLFAADGEVRADVTFAQLASYVWFNETKMGYEGTGDSPLLGVFEGRAIYLLYNGILKDKKPEGGNILTRAVFNSLPPFEGQKVIYAAAYQGGVNWIKKEQIIFKQTPYALETKI